MFPVRHFISNTLSLCVLLAKSLQEDNHITDKRVGTFSRLGNNANAFDEGFGRFSVVKRMDRMRRRPEMNSRGMNGDAFTGRLLLAFLVTLN